MKVESTGDTEISREDEGKLKSGESVTIAYGRWDGPANIGNQFVKCPIMPQSRQIKMARITKDRFVRVFMIKAC